MRRDPEERRMKQRKLGEDEVKPGNKSIMLAVSMRKSAFTGKERKGKGKKGRRSERN